MGGKLTALENRSDVSMEIRIFIPPARPDRYRKIIRIEPGQNIKVKTRLLCCDDHVNNDQEQHPPIFLMVFMDGVYTGVSLFPFHVKKYAKIIGYLDHNGQVQLKGIRPRLPCCCKHNRVFSSFWGTFTGKKHGGQPKRKSSYIDIE